MRVQQHPQVRPQSETGKYSTAVATMLSVAITMGIVGLIAFIMDVIFRLL
jgi:hypothetical protein